jgi:hypothetical protein
MQVSDYQFLIIGLGMSIQHRTNAFLKMTRLFAVLVALMGIGFIAQAQDRIEGIWHSGGIITTEDDTVECEFAITLATDIIQAKQGDKIATFSARQVNYLYFQDTETKKFRFVFSLAFALVPGGYKVPKFFELISEGQFASLLTRESVINDYQMEMNPYTGMMSSRAFQRLSFEYYIRKQSGSVYQVKTRKRDMLLILQDQEASIKQYLDETSLDFRQRTDLIRLLDHYNSICKAQQDKTTQGP